MLGTLNKRDDQDKGWLAEIAIPLADVNGLAKDGVKVPPKLGDSWRLNMFRMDSPEGKPQLASAWSPPLVGDFHALDKFGEIVFADEKGQVPATPAAAPGQGASTPTRPCARRSPPGWPARCQARTPAADLKKKTALRKRSKVARE